MTGSNRLLIGVGWDVPVLAYALVTGRREVVLARDQAVEVNYLALATLYSFVIPVKGTLAVYDTAILLVIFLAYARAAADPSEEPEPKDRPS
jgi:cation:H+ antiporter